MAGANDECMVCVNAFNGINGRFCHKLRRYVKHEPTPPCHPTKLSTNSNNTKSVSLGNSETKA